MRNDPPLPLMRAVEAFLAEECERRSWGGQNDDYFREAERLLKRVQRHNAQAAGLRR